PHQLKIRLRGAEYNCAEQPANLSTELAGLIQVRCFEDTAKFSMLHIYRSHTPITALTHQKNHCSGKTLLPHLVTSWNQGHDSWTGRIKINAGLCPVKNR